jgi:glycosyltransferase involved in cell wall biosynthesis
VLETEWGADVERFRPDADGPAPFQRKPGEVIVVFCGAFRAWHGAAQLAHALVLLNGRADGSSFHGVFIGDGPELPRVRDIARPLTRVTFTGALPHADMPSALAAADVGVAPFDAGAHAPLRLGFYWSPLKVFEYMASGLPVVVPDVGRLRELVAHDREGLLYAPPNPAALADALAAMAAPDVRRRLGAAARERAVREFSWSAHCSRLDAALRRLIESSHGAARTA